MIIETLWIKRKYGNTPPELVAAWDEFSIDENPQGWQDACTKALDSIGDDLAEHRYIQIRANVSSVWAVPTVEGEIV